MKILKIIALSALTFALSGIGINQWGKPLENAIEMCQTAWNKSEAAKAAYWEADYWKHHKRTMSADGVTYLGPNGDGS